MAIAHRALDWLSAILQATFVVALVPAASAWADCPGHVCDPCETRAMQTVDWTAIYLGNFAAGCALANPYERLVNTTVCGQASTLPGVWCPGPAVAVYDPYKILPSSANWGLLIDGARVCLSVDSLGFTFTGSSTSTTDDSSEVKSGDTAVQTANKTTSMEGLTVELPTFTFVPVTTTISVRDLAAPPRDCPCPDSVDRNRFGKLRGEPCAEDETDDECPLQLKPGEAAQEILELARRLGPGPLHDTVFDDEPRTVGVPIPGMDRCFRAQRNTDSLARNIRSLEARDRKRRSDPSLAIEAMFEDAAEQEPLRAVHTFRHENGIDKPRETWGVASAQVDALRQAGRMLEEAANLLEEQALYDRADELRGTAQSLRLDAREADARFWQSESRDGPIQDFPFMIAH